MTSNTPGEEDPSPVPASSPAPASSPDFNITLDVHAQLPGLQWVGGERCDTNSGGPPPKAPTGLNPLETWLLAQGVTPQHAFHAKQKTRPVLSQARDDDALTPIRLQLNAASIGNLALAINASAIRFLSITFDPLPSSSALSALLDTLHVRGLHTLQVFGKLSPATVHAIADYIASSRSAGLNVLRIDRGDCTVTDLEPLADAIERNTTIQKVWTVSTYDAAGFVDLFSLMERPNPTPRLRLALYRNRSLAVRVRRTVLAALGPARVLLRVASPGAASSPIALLPLELVTLVLQLASPDAHALLPTQWHTLFNYAADPCRQKATALALQSAVADGRTLDNVIDEWLLCGGFYWAHGYKEELPAS
ncbi:uncharacterized protein LOC62_06G007791 [Vanrija pseudolonga]|uniref:Uncharacterized protein n=1 Tax=Vanrija pseudolonga TaxID=143232 RepID=A0AAF0YGN1_9TREE|nr:hypothetical protein LOC62_06G007791 [Vanrija pseudolonga]